MTGSKRTTEGRQSSPLIFAAVSALVVLVIAATIYITQPPSEAGMDVEARSDGAGTLPDGVADEFQEGMRNDTATDNFIDNSAASDVTPPLLEVEGDAEEPVTNADNLDDVPEEMLDNG